MQNGSLAAAARSRYRNESAPSLMKLAGDGLSGSPGGSVHGQQLLGALPPGSPSPRKSADEAPLLLGGRRVLQHLCAACSVHWAAPCLCSSRCAVQPGGLWCMSACLLETKMCCATGDTCRAGATLKLHWLSSPTSVLVVAKPSPRVQQALQQVVAWLLHRHISVVLEPQVHHCILAS